MHRVLYRVSIVLPVLYCETEVNWKKKNVLSLDTALALGCVLLPAITVGRVFVASSRTS